MASLDATVGGLNSNSYVTRAWANDYLTTERLYTSVWTAASTANQDASLIWATRLLDEVVDWHGGIADHDQALGWPRYGAVDRDGRFLDSDIIPRDIMQVTADLALELLKRDRSEEATLPGLGFDEVGIDVIKIKVGKQATVGIIPDWIATKLNHYGIVDPDALGPGGGPSNVKLRRT